MAENPYSPTDPRFQSYDAFTAAFGVRSQDAYANQLYNQLQQQRIAKAYADFAANVPPNTSPQDPRYVQYFGAYKTALDQVLPISESGAVAADAPNYVTAQADNALRSRISGPGVSFTPGAIINETDRAAGFAATGGLDSVQVQTPAQAEALNQNTLIARSLVSAPSGPEAEAQKTAIVNNLVSSGLASQQTIFSSQQRSAGPLDALGAPSVSPLAGAQQRYAIDSVQQGMILASARDVDRRSLANSLGLPDASITERQLDALASSPVSAQSRARAGIGLIESGNLNLGLLQLRDTTDFPISQLQVFKPQAQPSSQATYSAETPQALAKLRGLIVSGGQSTVKGEEITFLPPAVSQETIPRLEQLIASNPANTGGFASTSGALSFSFPQPVSPISNLSASRGPTILDAINSANLAVNESQKQSGLGVGTNIRLTLPQDTRTFEQKASSVYDFAAGVQSAPVFSQLKGFADSISGASENLAKKVETSEVTDLLRAGGSIVPARYVSAGIRVAGSVPQALRAPEAAVSGAYGAGFLIKTGLRGDTNTLGQAAESFRAQSEYTVKNYPLETILGAGLQIALINLPQPGAAAGRVPKFSTSIEEAALGASEKPSTGFASLRGYTESGKPIVDIELTKQGQPIQRGTFTFDTKSPQTTAFRSYGVTGAGEQVESVGLVQSAKDIRLYQDVVPGAQTLQLGPGTSSFLERTAVAKYQPEIIRAIRSDIQQTVGRATGTPTATPQPSPYSFPLEDFSIARSQGPGFRSIGVIRDVDVGALSKQLVYEVGQNVQTSQGIKQSRTIVYLDPDLANAIARLEPELVGGSGTRVIGGSGTAPGAAVQLQELITGGSSQISKTQRQLGQAIAGAASSLESTPKPPPPSFGATGAGAGLVSATLSQTTQPAKTATITQAQSKSTSAALIPAPGALQSITRVSQPAPPVQGVRLGIEPSVVFRQSELTQQAQSVSQERAAAQIQSLLEGSQTGIKPAQTSSQLKQNAMSELVNLRPIEDQLTRPVQVTGPGQITRLTPVEILANPTLIKPIQTQPYPPNNPFGPAPPGPIFPGIPLLPGLPPGSSSGRGQRRKASKPIRYFYAPDLTASEFGITGKNIGAARGAEVVGTGIRPIIQTRQMRPVRPRKMPEKNTVRRIQNLLPKPPQSSARVVFGQTTSRKAVAAFRPTSQSQSNLSRSFGQVFGGKRRR